VPGPRPTERHRAIIVGETRRHCWLCFRAAPDSLREDDAQNSPKHSKVMKTLEKPSDLHVPQHGGGWQETEFTATLCRSSSLCACSDRASLGPRVLLLGTEREKASRSRMGRGIGELGISAKPDYRVHLSSSFRLPPAKATFIIIASQTNQSFSAYNTVN
jgi:hypothetical protein